MKIHSICVVKNEADIVGYCLREALKWSDYVYVYDGESTDGTWEVVKSSRPITSLLGSRTARRSKSRCELKCSRRSTTALLLVTGGAISTQTSSTRLIRRLSSVRFPHDITSFGEIWWSTTSPTPTSKRSTSRFLWKNDYPNSGATRLLTRNPASSVTAPVSNGQ